MIDVVNERWVEARGRMRPYVDAVFWQDLGVPSPDRERYVDWILDKIVKDDISQLCGIRRQLRHSRSVRVRRTVPAAKLTGLYLSHV